MNTSHASTGWELRFEPLFFGRRGYVFPCNAQGLVDMDALSERTLNNYLYARAMMALTSIKGCATRSLIQRKPSAASPSYSGLDASSRGASMPERKEMP